MKGLLKKTMLIISGLLLSLPVLACTQITLKAKDGTVVIARTLEFTPNLQSQIMTRPRGTVFTNKTPNGQQSFSWTSKYGYIYMNFFHQNFTVDGMNEKGLSVGELYLPGDTKYQTLTNENIKHAIPYYEIGDWVLSNFSTVAEVKAALPNMTIFSQGLPIPNQPGVVFPLHVIITDATGKSIVVEWINGKEHIYNGTALGILTNDPTYPWQITNLKNYANLSPYSPTPITVDGITYTSTGQGSGMLGLPGDTTPPSRFVKMALLTKTAAQPDTGKDAVILSDHIIDTVFIPYGTVRSTKAAGLSGYEKTQWTVLKDLTHLVLYFKSNDQPTLQSIDLNKIDFSKGAASLSMPITNPAPLSVDVTKDYKKQN